MRLLLEDQIYVRIFSFQTITMHVKIKFMIDSKTLQQITTKLATAAHPSKIIVFGSYARGDADAKDPI